MIEGPLSANRNSAVIFSAGTDGRLCAWDVTAVVLSFFHRSRLLDTENEDCVAVDSKSFTSLTETVSADVAAQRCDDSAGSDRLAPVYSTAVNATDRQAVLCYSSDTDEPDNTSERQDDKLEPCCVISAHQSGVNSLAVRPHVTGALSFMFCH